MNTALLDSPITARFSMNDCAGPADLVRGAEVCAEADAQPRLLARLLPAVRERNVVLDLSSVRRIDAAGISILLTLYNRARDSGHSFWLTNVPERIARILSVVGLDRLLLSHNAVQSSHCATAANRPAA